MEAHFGDKLQLVSEVEWVATTTAKEEVLDRTAFSSQTDYANFSVIKPVISVSLNSFTAFK